MGVLGSLDILRENGHILREAELNMFLDQAIFNGGEIERLTWNFIDAMRAESDVPPPWVKAFRLDAIVLDTLRHVDTFGHPLYADVPDAIEVLADSHLVRHVLRHLLSYAFKYAPPGPPVDVSVGLLTPVGREHSPA